MTDDEYEAQLLTELERVGISRTEAATTLMGAVPPGWLIPHDAPLRILCALPAGAGPEVFAAALRWELTSA
jgi:hypothetical protein